MSPPLAADGRIRLSRRQLFALELTHQDSAIDPFVIEGTPPPDCVAGLTEWSAQHGGETVSVGWDWYLAAPGIMAIYRPDLIRSNLMIVCERGTDQGARATAVHLLDRINHLDWQTPVFEQLGTLIGCPSAARN